MSQPVHRLAGREDGRLKGTFPHRPSARSSPWPLCRCSGSREFRQVWHLDKAELAVGVVCLLGALLLGPIAGIGPAFVLSLIIPVRRAANPPGLVLSRARIEDGTLTPAADEQRMTAPGLVMLRFAAPVFFANSTRLGNFTRSAVLAADSDVQHPVLDLEAATNIDVTGAEDLERLRGWLDRQQISLGNSRVRPEGAVRLTHFGLRAGSEIYRTNRDAVEAPDCGTRNPGEGTMIEFGRWMRRWASQFSLRYPRPSASCSAHSQSWRWSRTGSSSTDDDSSAWPIVFRSSRRRSGFGRHA